MNKRERALQEYSLPHISRLDVLYYEESLRKWTFAIRGHDVIAALTGAASPTAFLRQPKKPFHDRAWFYLSLCAGLGILLKPILRLDEQIALSIDLTFAQEFCDREIPCDVLGLNRLRKNSCCNIVLKGHDISRAANAGKINAGFSPGGMSFSNFNRNPEFFRSL